ncbi:protein unc-93 homolog A-like [Lingula anatina]|uniref:Protein unc-93 homolog A-like n=1 Tax=Lingula anatina TaxID=7574 RepID=A0A1S3GZV4_LINAN|nr:protein unc-93 homolog A-like [Lingula anatina]|eukprot:XP_013379207.1 protein unc-93 homolog A-like [Lingula anatina]
MATDDKVPKTSGLQVPTNLDTATTKMLASGNVADDSRVPEVEYNFSKGRHLKNVLVSSLAFTLVFTAFSGLESLQSSINKDQGLGVYGLVFIYSTMIISCLFLAPPVISLLGCKWTITAAMATYTTYTLANFYAVWGTMAPASVILGLGGTLLWSANSMYITETATQYAQITGKNKDVLLPGFFGIFFGIVHTCRVWGNLISSLVLSQRPQNETEISDEVFSRCGATYCTGDENLGNVTNSGLDKPSEEKLQILCGTYLACGLMAVGAVAIFLDDIHRHKSAKSQPKKRFSSALFVATFKHMRKPKQLLLIPITVYCSMQMGFFSSDFTKAFVSCTYGIWNVGYVMMTYGVTSSLNSIVIGRLAKRVRRPFFFTIAMLLHYGLLFTFLFWQPTPDGLLILYVLAGLWGAADAVWTTEINVLYGVLFHDSQEAAFSCYRLWHAFGFILAYVFSVQLCVFMKLYILMGTLALSMLGYLTVELMQRKCQENTLETRKTVEAAIDMLGSNLTL